MHTSSLAIDFQKGWSDAWSAVAQFLPKLAGFLVILLVGWIVARLVATIVDRVLERVGFDRLVERGGIDRMLARSNWDASDLLAKLAYYAILLIALQLGFGVFGPNPVSDLLDGIVSWLPKAAVAIVIVVVAAAIAHAARELLTNMLGSLSYGPMLGRIAAVFIWGVGIVAALNQIGVATSVTMPVLITVLATIGGILVVGIGGGMIRPMQQRWEGWLSGLEAEMPAVKGHADAYQRGREDVARQQMWMDQQAARGQGRQTREPAHGGYPQAGAKPQSGANPQGMNMQSGANPQQGMNMQSGANPQQGASPQSGPQQGVNLQQGSNPQSAYPQYSGGYSQYGDPRERR